MGLRQLASLSGIHRSHLSRAERGLAGLSEDNIRAIAQALHVEPEDISEPEDLTEEEPP